MRVETSLTFQDRYNGADGFTAEVSANVKVLDIDYGSYEADQYSEYQKAELKLALLEKAVEQMQEHLWGMEDE